MEPRTQYTKTSDGVNIAYQVVGDGPLDIVEVPSSFSHLEAAWEEPSCARMWRRFASFSRIILLDKRGTGLSDRVTGVATLEERMDDVRAVMDAVGSERAAVLGGSEGGPMAALFAATYPERNLALILYGTAAKFAPSSEYRPTPEQLQPVWDAIERTWGQGVSVGVFAPSRAEDERFKQWWARYERLSASPGAVVALLRMNMEIDVRDILPVIAVPTLIIHRTGDRSVGVEEGRDLARRIPGAKYVELPGIDHLPFVGDQDAIVDEIEEFLTGMRHRPEPDRMLATVLFTDIVGSTERVAELGDRRWRELLNDYYALGRSELARFQGREVKTTGDGFLATFDGPARAIRCACATSDVAQTLGIRVRAGLHCGECEMMGGDIGGIAVHIASRVASMAAPDEVLVSSTVKDLVAGSGIGFEDRGPHRLKGVPDEWRLFAVRERGA